MNVQYAQLWLTRKTLDSLRYRMTVSASDKKSEFLAGIRDELPLQLGVFPFGLVFGIAGIESGLSALQTFFLSTILFGGASQIVFIQLIASGTPLPVLIASVSTINLRHALYGVSVSRYLQHLPVGWRIILGYLLTDEAYAISIRRFTMQPASAYMHFHLLGTGLTLWLCWHLSTACGIVLGATIPDYLQLSFAIPLTFIAVITPLLRQMPMLVATLVSGATAVMLHGMPWNLWLIIAAFAGIIAAVIAERLTSREARSL